MSGATARSGRLRVAFQGAYGAFSHEACEHVLPHAEAVPFRSFAQVFEAVAGGDCELGFTPVENTIAGRVPEVAERLPASGLAILSEHPWPIRMQLMSVAGARLETVRTVASHPMALKQCRTFIQAHGLAVEEAFDTAGAAAELAANPDLSRAAIAPRKAAQRYGLVILAPDIQDQDENITRFVVLGRRSPDAA